MRSPTIKLMTGFAVAISVLWLAGYANALRPFAASGIRDGNYSFLTYPDIKVYREIDETTGALSSRQIDFYSTVDAPTGTEVTDVCISGWIVSLGALAAMLGGGLFLLFSGRKTGE